MRWHTQLLYSSSYIHKNNGVVACGHGCHNLWVGYLMVVLHILWNVYFNLFLGYKWCQFLSNFSMFRSFLIKPATLHFRHWFKNYMGNSTQHFAFSTIDLIMLSIRKPSPLIPKLLLVILFFCWYLNMQSFVV